MIFINKEYLSFYLVIYKKKLQYWSAKETSFILPSSYMEVWNDQTSKWPEQKVALTNNF